LSRRVRLLIVFVIVAATLLFVPLPILPTYAGRTIENAGHTPLFLVGTLFILAILRHDLRVEGVRLYLYAGVLGVGCGLLSEVIQKPLRRDASWEDVFADAMGVLLALALYALFDRRSAFRGRTRLAALLIVIGCTVNYLAPIVSMVHAYIYRDGQFPVLASFRSRAELSWMVGYGITREIRDGALDVRFDAAQFPGFSFHEPVPDWRRYQALVIDVENPETTRALKLGLRVHDIGRGREFIDRFNRKFELAAGERRSLRIPLEEIRRGPRNRLINMGQISDVTLFRLHDSPSQHLRLYNMRLE
jgi:VanZ family protein